jgi:hypothetical protein
MFNFFRKKNTNIVALFSTDNDWRISSDFLTSLVSSLQKEHICFEKYLYHDSRYKEFKGILPKISQSKSINDIELISLYSGVDSSLSEITITIAGNHSIFANYIILESIKTIDILSYLNIITNSIFNVEYGYIYKGLLGKHSLGYSLGMQLSNSNITSIGRNGEKDMMIWKNKIRTINKGYLRDIYTTNILNEFHVQFKLNIGLSLLELIESDVRFGTIKPVKNIFVWCIKENNLEFVRKKMYLENIIMQ